MRVPHRLRRRGPALPLRAAAAAYRFRESLFALPALIVLGGVLLSELAAAADRSLDGRTAVPLTLDMNANAAIWLLATVAGAMITTAGVVFSLTVVSLQLASSQFSPRVMRSFIRDRLSQVVIGLLVATFVYSVLTLRHVSGEETEPAPRVALTLAVVLAVATVILIVAHLDHLARGLQVGQVARAISAEGERVIAALADEVRHEHAAPTSRAPGSGTWTPVPAPRDGWVTRAPSDLLFAAVPPGTTVRLETRVGAYIHEGEPLVTLCPPPTDLGGVTRNVAAAVLISDGRTMQQDVDFAVRQLVDIGLRALSSAVNDPTTAVEVTLRLGSLLRKLLTTEPPAAVVEGSDGRLLLRPWELTHEEYVAHAFDQLRQCAPPQPQVAAALLRVLHMLVGQVRDAGREHLVPALQRQIDRLLDALSTTDGLHPDDVARLRAIGDGTDPADHSHPVVDDAVRP
jgi:uncharacterized membrane protein